MCIYIYTYICVGRRQCVCLFYSSFSRAECQKLTLYPTKKSPLCPLRAKLLVPVYICIIHIYSLTHMLVPIIPGLFLSLSPSFPLSHYNIYITLYFRTQKWTVCGWQSSSVICVRVGSEHVCVCVCLHPLSDCATKTTCLYVCVCVLV